MAGVVAGTWMAVAGSPANAAPNPLRTDTRVPAAVLTPDQALQRATSTGKAVPVDGSTTATDALTANPDGTFTMTRAALPVRKMVSGAWTNLDATLVHGPDGGIHPANSTYGLTLSSGGSGPLAVMNNTGHSLAVSAPMTLPTPTLSGDTATYPDVLPGVDLEIHADTQGGFRHVFVIHNAAAAANPALKTITMGVQASGVTVTADAGHNLAASDSHGHTVFAAPAPHMWDSATPGTATSSSAKTGAKAPAVIAGSSATATSPKPNVGASPNGGSAHDAPVGVTLESGAMVLTPDKTMLTAANTVYPVYVDPGWSSLGSSKSGWATVAEPYPTSKYWDDTPDPEGLMQAGNSGSMWSHTLINMPIKTSTLADATINNATFNITEVYAYSCTASKLNIYAPSQTLTSSNAYWNAWDGKLGSAIDSATVAYGYNSSCPAHGIGFDVTTAIKAAVKAGKTTQTFGLAGASEGSDGSSWKEFSPSSPTMSITYNHAPNQPTGLTTSPATACSAATPTVVGDGDVKLYAPVSDKDGGTLGVYYTVYKSSNLTTPVATSSASQLQYPSGSTAVFTLHKTDLETWSSGVTEFTWKVEVSDTVAWSSWSASCRFDFDETRPGPPKADPPADGTTKIGQQFNLDVTAPATGTVPTAYEYQLNGAAPKTVTATGGAATLSVTPTRFTNVLTITSVSASGNAGAGAANVVFNSQPADLAADQDLTGDGIADLLTVGNTNGLPAGLWLAQGQAGTGHTNGTGQIVPSAVDIGINGSRIGQSDSSPASYNNAEVITGTFTGNGLQDVLAYYPTGTDTAGDNTGTMVVLAGNGDGTPIRSQQLNNVTATYGGLQDWDYSDNPLQVVNAGNTSGRGLQYPDMLGTSGDSTNGYWLAYYDSDNATGVFDVDRLTQTLTPTGGTDWNTWTLASAQLPSGTALYLWQKSTGALYLWTHLAHAFGDNTITYQQTALGTWNTNASISLQATDVNGDGTADLWATGASGVTTAWLNTANTTLTSTTGQTVIGTSHNFVLNDGEGDTTTSGDPVTTVTDSVGGLTAAGNAGATWNTGGFFDPDVAFNGSSGALTSSASAVNTGADFSISAWVKPTTSGGYVLSQDGAHQASFVLYPGTDNLWYFGMSQSDSGKAVYDVVHNAEGPVHYGVWQHVTATFSKATATMALYVDGNPVFATIRASTATTTATAHSLQIGDYQYNGTHTGYFSGEIADVETWNRTLSPDQIANISGTPDHILFPSDNTNYVSGATTWTSPCSTMTFSQGQLSILETCKNKGTRVDFGSTGYPDAVLVLQTDGNLVIYKTSTASHTASNSLWSSGTNGYTGDSMFLQPDGNLVIYSSIGKPIWAAHTYNS